MVASKCNIIDNVYYDASDLKIEQAIYSSRFLSEETFVGDVADLFVRIDYRHASTKRFATFVIARTVAKARDNGKHSAVGKFGSGPKPVRRMIEKMM